MLIQVKKKKGLDSRQIMMDQEDQFTLSISDREDSSSIIKADPNSADKFAVMKQNKSLVQVQSSKNNDEQATNKKGLSRNSSAVYKGDMTKAKRQKFE